MLLRKFSKDKKNIILDTNQIQNEKKIFSDVQKNISSSPQKFKIEDNEFRKNFKSIGQTPYGKIYFNGKLITDPREHLVIKQILKLHKNNFSNSDIADFLNNKNIPTRKNTKWSREVIRTIISRAMMDDVIDSTS